MLVSEKRLKKILADMLYGRYNLLDFKTMKYITNIEMAYAKLIFGSKRKS